MQWQQVPSQPDLQLSAVICRWEYYLNQRLLMPRLPRSSMVCMMKSRCACICKQRLQHHPWTAVRCIRKGSSSDNGIGSGSTAAKGIGEHLAWCSGLLCANPYGGRVPAMPLEWLYCVTGRVANHTVVRGLVNTVMLARTCTLS
jgi:hypothetical protein